MSTILGGRAGIRQTAARAVSLDPWDGMALHHIRDRTVANVRVLTNNTSESYRQATGKIVRQMIELGLPES